MFLLRFLCGKGCKPTTDEDLESQGYQGVSAVNVGVTALAHDLSHFEINSQVPELPAGVKYEFQTFPDTQSEQRGNPCSKVSNSTKLLNRGIDAPENAMPYGKEAKEELTKIVQGQSLRVLVYGEDQYERYVLFLSTLVSFVLVNTELTYPSSLTARN
ncbi:staphylococcal-like nuclease can2 [Quercus suber]|uniref:Staphylococcal-like nuclease can2 n=1 Tax=Quercus suber TaxID=58331 RepID=A0AAW0M1T8_QUESU